MPSIDKVGYIVLPYIPVNTVVGVLRIKHLRNIIINETLVGTNRRSKMD